MNESFRDAPRVEFGRGGPPLSPLRVVANQCSAGCCPTVYLSYSGTLVVQGYVVSGRDVGIEIPEGESLIEVPASLLGEAVLNLR